MQFDWTTFLFFLALYIWGFSLTIWSIFIDKSPTKLSRNVSIFALLVLIASLGWFAYRWWLFFGASQNG